ncbi:hypothetical protein KCU88_g248, partial [Aureobasidium melanogenum]
MCSPRGLCCCTLAAHEDQDHMCRWNSGGRPFQWEREWKSGSIASQQCAANGLPIERGAFTTDSLMLALMYLDAFMQTRILSFARRVTHPGPVVRYRDPTVVADRLGKVQAGKRGNLIIIGPALTHHIKPTANNTYKVSQLFNQCYYIAQFVHSFIILPRSITHPLLVQLRVAFHYP